MRRRSPCRHPAAAAAAVHGLLASTAVVDGLDSAAGLIGERPGLTAVTLAGDVFTALTVTGGSAKAPSLLEVQAAVDDAASRLARSPQGWSNPFRTGGRGVPPVRGAGPG